LAGDVSGHVDDRHQILVEDAFVFRDLYRVNQLSDADEVAVPASQLEPLQAVEIGASRAIDGSGL